MNAILAALLALTTFGGATAIAGCTDLAGQGYACHDVRADPATGVDADVLVVLEPQVPPVALAQTAVEAPECTDLAGQGYVCHEVSADPATGVDADVLVVVEPQLPVA